MIGYLVYWTDCNADRDVDEDVKEEEKSSDIEKEEKSIPKDWAGQEEAKWRRRLAMWRADQVKEEESKEEEERSKVKKEATTKEDFL